MALLSQHCVEYSFRQLLLVYYIMQMHYVSLFVHTVGYAEHVWTTAPEMESASWQLAWRKGCDVTLKPKDCQLTCLLSHFFNTQVTLLLRALSWNVWGRKENRISSSVTKLRSGTWVSSCVSVRTQYRVKRLGSGLIEIPMWRNSPQWARVSFTRFLDHTQRRITVGRTPLDEWSARRRDLYLTTHNTHNRQTSMPPVGF